MLMPPALAQRTTWRTPVVIAVCGCLIGMMGTRTVQLGGVIHPILAPIRKERRFEPGILLPAWQLGGEDRATLS